MNKKGKISISIGGFQQWYGDRRALEIAKEIGAEAVDYDLSCVYNYRREGNIYAKSDEEIVAYAKEMATCAAELGLEIGQTHGRGEALRGEEHVEFNHHQLENLRRDFLFTAALGAPICVIHAVPTVAFPLDAAPQLLRDANFRLFTAACGFAKQYGVKVATETFGDAPPHDLCDFFGNIDEFIKSYNRVCAVEDYKDHYVTCADTGHSNKASRFGNPTPADVIRMLGGSLACLHLNDNDTLTDQHKLLTTGCIDWDDVFDALDEVNYQGNYNLELNLTHVSQHFAVEEGAYAIRVLKEILRMRAAGERIKK